MYKQIKKYVILAEHGAKLADAGLQKISLTNRKIRIEYFLNTLPIYYGTEMECVLRYRRKGEVVSSKSWKSRLEKGNSHYVFSLDHPEYIGEIVDCCLVLPGNKMIVSDEKLTLAEISATEEEKKVLPVADKRETRSVEYIRDLEYLKEAGGGLEELYYNSFLRHGFYRYRYFIVGKDFIGVPDHFYEREAIAAGMMGFPYFMEAEFVEDCNLDGETRDELPKQGSFGYYLKKIHG
ncbi:MAG: hypothetical protein E7289_03675 [Lachnospiraceae bacterium]|nr:hypothetical protein [Lachnospiraceae bacterium]